MLSYGSLIPTCSANRTEHDSAPFTETWAEDLGHATINTIMQTNRAPLPRPVCHFGHMWVNRFMVTASHPAHKLRYLPKNPSLINGLPPFLGKAMSIWQNTTIASKPLKTTAK